MSDFITFFMLDHKHFTQLQEQHDSYRQKRHQLIKDSADILKESKRAIFAIHRDNHDEASSAIKEAEKKIKDIQQQIQIEPRLRYEGSFSAALEEYVEAYALRSFVTTGTITLPTSIPLEYDEVLGGITDVTGEIVRKAVLLATEGKFDTIRSYHETVRTIIGELILLDMTGKLRNKYDQAKRNLKRLEEILYDISISSRT